jgi:Sec-independent protein secretion pathway component TatC
MMLIPLYLLYELGIALIVWVPVSRISGGSGKRDE